MFFEQVGHADLFRHDVRADALENVILRHFAAWRQRPAPRGDRLDLRAQRNLSVEKFVSRIAIGGAFVGVREVGHGIGLQDCHVPLNEPRREWFPADRPGDAPP